MNSDLSTRGDSTDTIAMVVEIVFGLFGIMGMGWVYVGRLGTGIGLFAGWLIAVLTTTVLVTVLTAFLGVGCLVILVPMQLVIAIVSSLRVRDYVRKTGATGSVGNLIIAAVIGAVLLCLALAIPLFALGGLATLGGAQ